MTYTYVCIKCDREFDVIKSVRDIDVNEFCPSCEAPGERQFVPKNVYFSGAKVEHAEFNPGLGQVVRNKHHKEELCKRLGVVEIGNDYKTPQAMQKEFTEKREEKLKKRWEDD